MLILQSFVDRDIFIRHRGGGVGHKCTWHLNESLLKDGADISAEEEENEQENEDSDSEHSEDEQDEEEEEETDDGSASESNGLADF